MREPEVPHYGRLLQEIKGRIQRAQTRAVLAANAELVHLYWEIGGLIDRRQEEKGWGAGIIPQLARDLHNELPELKGFSERNIKSMLAFYRDYPSPEAIVQQPVAQLPAPQKGQQPVAQIQADSLLWSIPWGHHVHLMTNIKDLAIRRWYIEQTIANGWSRNVLSLMIESEAHRRAGKTINNFAQRLPTPQSDLVQQALKDPYIFDFLTLDQPFHERELETELVLHLEKFLLELGQGFAFVGRQFRLDVGGEDFYIDLLFYHLRLRAYLVIDLKTGKFKPEYAGKLNFYCNVINEQLRHPEDQPTIGLILCQTKDNVLAEYALTGIEKPIGVSSYELTRALPRGLRSVLPTVEEIETELAAAESRANAKKPARKNIPRKSARPTKASKKQAIPKNRRKT